MNKLNLKKGFTLVELLVVIAIISILTIITVGQFQTARMKANDVQRKAGLSSVSKALEMYFADYGVFPAATTQGQIQTLDAGGNVQVSDWGMEFNDRNYSYMKKLPYEFKYPTLPQFYYQVSVTDRKSFALFAMLENTSDSDCKMNGGVGQYSKGGKNYCFAIVSPNASLDANGNFN